MGCASAPFSVRMDALRPKRSIQVRRGMIGSSQRPIGGTTQYFLLALQWLNLDSIACLWLLICRVFNTFDCPCPGPGTFEHTPLLSSKAVWEARTQEEWKGEKDFHSSHSPIKIFGELIDARRKPNEPTNARRLEAWEAGTDKLGFLMNLAVTFVEREKG